MKTPQEIQREIDELSQQLKANHAKLSQIQFTCRHEWGTVVYDPEVREAYTDPGDPPGTMGIDWRGPFHYPRQETPRWKRTCAKCGKTEITTRTDEKVTTSPRFS